MDVAGKVVVVTGGASGLGAETAKEFAKAGGKVCLLDLNVDKAREFAQTIGCIAAKCDVSSTSDISAAVEVVQAKLGVPQIVINAAGIGGGARIINRDGSPMPLDTFRRTIEVNLIGTFDVVRLFSAAMIKGEPAENGERGVIIMTASVAVDEGQVGQAPYSASKGGVASMTLPIAREFARFGVRVATISPGLFATPMMATLPEKVQAALGQSVPFPSRLGSPAEYAALARHIVENTYINGSVYRLDGGARLAPG